MQELQQGMQTKEIWKFIQNSTSFTDCVSNINNTQVDSTKDLDVVMQMYNLIEYSNSYVKTANSTAVLQE